LQQPSGIDAPSTTLPEASPEQLERVSTSGSGNGKLELHSLGSAASEIRLKIQKARQIVAGMVDVDRTVEEQEEEIQELETRIERQRAMLRKLGVNVDALEGGSGT
jgi:DNA repair ATPase RecN